MLEELDMKARISKKESYVGYYADIDGDGTVDGVIFADLAFDTERRMEYDR